MACKAHPVREARLRLGLRQAELAEKLGVSTRAVQAWEAWRSVPDGAHLAGLKEVLGLGELDEWRCSHRPAERMGPAVQGIIRRAPIW